MTGDSLIDQIDDLRDMMARRLRVRGRTFEAQVRKAGRSLPKAVRRDAVYLAQAEQLAQHPKLSMMVDAEKAAKAHSNVSTFLNGIDPRDRAKGRILNWLGSIAFVLIVAFVLAIWIMVDRGVI